VAAETAPAPPPAAPEAERSVIGQILRGGSEIAGEVVGTIVTPEDFYQPDHRLIFEAIAEAYRAGQPLDSLSVGERVAPKLMQLWRCPEQHVLLRIVEIEQAVEFAGRVTDHARLVQAEASRRKLLAVADSIRAEVASEALSPEEIASMVSKSALEVAMTGVRSHEMTSFAAIGRRYIAQLRHQRRLREEGVETGAYFGLRFLDQHLKGLKPGECLMGAGEPGVGKALALDTPLPTPTGWTMMGDVAPGDELLDESGSPCLVEAATEHMVGRPCYRMVFSDGSEIIADAEHQWMTANRRDYMQAWRRGNSTETCIRTTAEIAATLHRSDGGVNHSVPVAEPLDLQAANLPVSPYVLGCWLGDGSLEKSRITCAEDELMSYVADEGFRVSRVDGIDWKVHGLGRRLAAIGVRDEKRIPLSYLRAGQEQRLALLQGIVDTDGHVSHNGRVEITLMNEPFARDVWELVMTLGMKASFRIDTARLDGRVVGERQRIGFLPDLPVARLERKVARLKLDGHRRGTHLRRYIVNVERIASVPVRCVQVSSPSSLYLAGETFIPTHNSAVFWTAARRFAERQTKKPADRRIGALVLSLEMDEDPTGIRLAQSITGLDGGKLREAKVSDSDIQLITREWGRRKEIPLWFDFKGSLRASQLRALIVEAIHQHNVGLVVIDHFKNWHLDKRLQSPIQEDEDKAEFLSQEIAKDLNVAVICIAHTTKGVENAADRRPQLTHLRGSYQVAAQMDWVTFVYRPFDHADEDKKLTGSVKETDAELIYRKARHNFNGIVPFHFDPVAMKIE
jgi:replicative DNA helicase